MEHCDCAPRYVGSFPVKEADSRRRVWIIEEQMRFLKDCPRRRAVILKFCLQGVKMYDSEGETLLMAHALRRIQYTTCRPEDRQFAFVSRNPHRPANQLFCHLFVGGQPSEAQVLNLLLCRSFQLQYLYSHPEVEDTKASACAAPKGQRKGFRGGVIREPLDPEQVTPNVNALVSFRRLPEVGEDSIISSQSEISEGTNIPRSSSSDTPYCSPTLVRKKAIRSKVIRCGAYRCPNYESQLRSGIRPQTTGRTSHSPLELSEKPDVLVDAVWFCAGIDSGIIGPISCHYRYSCAPPPSAAIIYRSEVDASFLIQLWVCCRDSSLALLKEDRMGAFLLRPDLECSGHFTLYMSTQCGVIPYKIYTNQKAKYCFEHLPQQFPSLASLVEHHAGSEGSLFFQLAHGRVNPCYETEDPQSSPPSPRETADTEQRPAQEEEEEEEEEEEVSQRQDEGSPTDAPAQPSIHITI